MRVAEADILIVPGYLNSGPEHWQNRWEKKLSTARRVEQRDWERPNRDEWVEAIVREVRASARPAVLVAHSLGVIAALHAAQLLRNMVAGAFLVAPPSEEAIRETPAFDSAFLPVPRSRLPFPAIIVGSSDDPYADPLFPRRLAEDIGGYFIDAGAAGHINADSGRGPGPRACSLSPVSFQSFSAVTPRPGIFLCAAVVVFSGGAARAELSTLEETAAGLHAVFRLDGKSYGLDAKIARPPKPAAVAALLVDLEADDDLAPLALARGVAVVSPDLAKLPLPLRARALRELGPRLREMTGAKRALGRGRDEQAKLLLETGALFDGLLIHRAEAVAAPLDPKAPRVIEIFGSEAYWRAEAASAGDGAPEGANRRRFFIAGAAPAAGAANCAAPVNARPIGPALRALLAVLDDWTKGTAPPASRAPPSRDLTAAKTRVWPKIPGLPAPPPGERLVPKIDADGNEIAGLRLPDHALPVATFTGFNARKDAKGPPCAAGASLPFPSTRAERERTGDPRPSLVERYGSRAYFVATMRVVADRLVKERLLLKEDADAYVAAAKSAPF